MSEIIFMIEEDLESGFSANALGYPIFTQGSSKEELKENILDAVKCHFDNEEEIPKIIRLHFVKGEILTYA